MSLARPIREPRLGLRENFGQFVLLAVDNAFVGMLIGSERTLVPLLGRQVFHVSSLVVLLSFIVAFGAVKGPLNLVAGRLADRFGRRPVLIAGWILGLPVPWLLIFASGWWLVVVANLLLGANQGLAWSMTVTSKIDLVGPNHRGLALGINEFTGYLGVAMATAVSGLLAARFGLRPTPLLLAAAYTVAGLLIPLIFIRETLPFARLEGRETGITGALAVPTLGHIFWRVTWADRRLFACNLAGMLNKFSDTAVWALVPLVMARQGFGSAAIGLVAGLYAATWGIAQLGTGVLSDHIGRKHPIVGGLVLNAAGLAGAGFAHSTAAWLAAAMAMGLGTSLVYPVLLAAVSDATEPAWRATALGVYRMWRDGGYAIGGLAVGWASALLAPRGAFFILAAVLLGSSLVVTISLRAHRSVRNTAST